jgi:hypothetical protein
LELFNRGVEVQIVDLAVQMPRCLQLGLDESAINNQARRDIGELGSLLPFNRFHHGFEIPLHGIDADGERILQREILGGLGQYRLEVAMNNMAKLPFELSVLISLARLKLHRGMGIVDS